MKVEVVIIANFIRGVWNTWWKRGTVSSIVNVSIRTRVVQADSHTVHLMSEEIVAVEVAFGIMR